MKLYTTPGALNPARLQFVLAEKGIEIEREVVNLMKLEHKQADYQGKSMNGLVPLLELDDGTRICESVVIAQYLESLYPEPNLFGRDARERAEIGMCDRMIELQVTLPFAHAFRHGHPAMSELEDQVPEFGEKQKKWGQARLARLEEQMAGREYVAANRFTIADITLWCTFRFFRKSGAELTDAHPLLRAWFDRIGQRPAAQTAFTQ